MKRAVRTSLIDFCAGLAAIGLVFLVVTYIHPSASTIAIYVSVFYMIAGLMRGADKNTHPLLKLVLLSLFGVIYIPLTGDRYSMLNMPYPVTAVLFTLLGLLISANWSSITRLKRAFALALPILAIIVVSILVLPQYFNFWSSYVHGDAPEFELRTFDGEIIRSSELSGKVILLDFWDTHCGPCRKLMPDMEELCRKYKENPDVKIIVVNAGWEPIESAREFISKNAYDLPFAYDDGSVTSRSMNVRELPTTIIIDKQYQFRFKHVGYNPTKDEDPVNTCDGHIDLLLSE